VLRRAGASVITAENGKIGVDVAMGQAFDVILMDMQMPVMDGYTATRFLRDQGLTVPIVALTAHAMQGDEDKCRSAGCSDFLTKPIDPDTLLTFVDQILKDKEKRAVDREIAARRAIGENAWRHAIDGGQPLMSTLPMDDADFREIAVEFVQRLKEKLECMHQAWVAGDFSALAELAHWLKGAGGTAGFPVFGPAAAQLEQLAKTGQIGPIEAALAKLVELSGRIVVPESNFSTVSVTEVR
jgi:CheY-like chemotaxis protein